MLQNFDDLQGHDPEAEEAIASLDDEPKAKDEAKADPPSPPVAAPSEQPKPQDQPKAAPDAPAAP